MAEETRRQIKNSLDTGAFVRNAPLTIQKKGHSKVLVGLTRHLRDMVTIKPGGQTHYAVGYFDDPHPDTEGRLSMGDLATIQVFGMPSAKNPGPLHIFGIPQTEARIPGRDFMTPVADNPERANRIRGVGLERLARGLNLTIGGA